MSDNFVDLAYLLAAALFILGIKGLTRPRTAVRGNMLSASGMLIAIVVTLLDKNVLSYEWIIGGIALGGIIGAVIASRIQMTAIPQMVALLNGFGGGASLAVAVANYFQGGFGDDITSTISLVAIGATTVIGAVTLTGSVRGDLAFVDRVLGVKFAINEPMAADVTFDRTVSASSEALLGAGIAGLYVIINRTRRRSYRGYMSRDDREAEMKANDPDMKQD